MYGKTVTYSRLTGYFYGIKYFIKSLHSHSENGLIDETGLMGEFMTVNKVPRLSEIMRSKCFLHLKSMDRTLIRRLGCRPEEFVTKEEI